MKRDAMILSLAILCLLLVLSACSGNGGGFTGIDHSSRPTSDPAETPGESSQTPDPDPHDPNGGEWTDIIPVYSDGDMTVEINGAVVGIAVLKTNEGYFTGYVNTLKADGWDVEEAPGASNFYIAGKGKWAVSLIYADSTAAILLCPVVD